MNVYRDNVVRSRNYFAVEKQQCSIYKYWALHNQSFHGKFMSLATMQIIRTSFCNKLYFQLIFTHFTRYIQMPQWNENVYFDHDLL